MNRLYFRFTLVALALLLGSQVAIAGTPPLAALPVE